MAKKMTNEQAFKSLIKDASPIELALLRERILAIMEMTRKDIFENPEQWEKSLVSQNLVLGLATLVEKHLAFEN